MEPVNQADRQLETLSGVTPNLVVSNGPAAVEFYKKAFAAEVVGAIPAEHNPDKLMHASLRINGGSLFLNDAFPEYGQPLQPPQSFVLHIHVADVKAWWERAVAAGCEIVMPLDVQFWGDRYGQLRDPFGVTWSLGGQP